MLYAMSLNVLINITKKVWMGLTDNWQMAKILTDNWQIA